jgi:exonuclease SbcD
VKLLHFADLHLGVDNYGTQDAVSGVSSRSRDILRALDQIVDRAIDEPVDAVLFAGDAFKNRDPSPTLQRELAKRVARLVSAEIPIILLVGNHDMPGALGRATAAEIYEVLRIPGVHVAREVGLIELQTRSGPLQVVAVPWVTRSMALVNESLRQLVDADLDEAIRNAISFQVRMLASQLDATVPRVLLAHVSLQGADFGLERSLMLGRDISIGADDLGASAFDYVALGHIHKHQVLGAHPPVVYAGSPERIDFGEEGEDKGYVLVDIGSDETGTRRTSWEFVELPARRFETLRIDATGGAPLDVVERDIETSRVRIKGAVVRAFITVDAEQESTISVARIRKLIGECEPFALAGIRIETEDRRRARMELDLADALDQSRMLERWIASRSYDGERAELIRSLGNELIARQRARDDD